MSRWRKVQKWREARKAHERSAYAAEMTARHGAPADCELAPFDCVLLEQSIRAAGNDPPRWIVSASSAWLAANGHSPAALRPVRK